MARWRARYSTRKRPLLRDQRVKYPALACRNAVCHITIGYMHDLGNKPPADDIKMKNAPAFPLPARCAEMKELSWKVTRFCLVVGFFFTGIDVQELLSKILASLVVRSSHARPFWDSAFTSITMATDDCQHMHLLRDVLFVAWRGNDCRGHGRRLSSLE